MVKAISPQDVLMTKHEIMPDEVIETWNHLIAQNYANGKSVVEQHDVLDRICATMRVDTSHVFEHKWLDIEDIYRSVGWDVEYYVPHYAEIERPRFTFRPNTV